MLRTVSSSFPGNKIEAQLAPVAFGEADEKPVDWLEAERELAALSLMTVDYGLCRLEIAHARKYLGNGEPGAAAFEVRLLLGRLARLGFIPVEAPKTKGDDR